MITEALREIEIRKVLGFDSARLSLSRYGNSRKDIKALRHQLREAGYETKIEKSSGVIMVKWSQDA